MKTNPNPNPVQPTHNACSAPDPRPKWKRVLARLWPYKHHFEDFQPWAKDVIYCETVVSLSFADRLRVFASGRLRVRSATLCENVPGKTASTSIAHPLPPQFVDGRVRNHGVPPSRFRPVPPPPPEPPRPPGPTKELHPIPVTEIRDGDVLVVAMSKLFSDEEIAATRSRIVNELSPISVRVVFQFSPDLMIREIVGILRPVVPMESASHSPGKFPSLIASPAGDAAFVRFRAGDSAKKTALVYKDVAFTAEWDESDRLVGVDIKVPTKPKA